MSRLYRFTTAASLAAFVYSPLIAFAKTPVEKMPVAPVRTQTTYYRYDRDGKTGGSGDCELLSRRFKNPKTGDIVTLTAMIHFADAAFYGRVNALAKQHDVVLLEGIQGSITFSGLPLLYRLSLTRRMLASARLEGQLDHLNQTGPRYRNADVEFKDMNTGSGAFCNFLTLPFIALLGESTYIVSGVAENASWLIGCGSSYGKGAREITASVLSGEKMSKEDQDFDKVIVKRPERRGAARVG